MVARACPSICCASMRSTTDSLEDSVAAPSGVWPQSPGRNVQLAALAAVAIGAFALRIRPLLAVDRFGVLGYDELVYFSGARAIGLGHLPYRDFAFLHPPFILEILVPFAWFGRVGLTAAKVVWALLGAASASMILRLLGPRAGFVGATVGAACYATWRPSVGTTWNVLLEPVVTAASLLALSLALSPRLSDRRSYGFLLGLALSIAAATKVTAVAPVFAIAAVVLIPRADRRTFGWSAFGLVAGLLATFGPVVGAAPAEFAEQVFATQADRTANADLGTAYRLAAMLWPGSAPADPSAWFAALLVVGLVAIMCASVAAQRALGLCAVVWTVLGIALGMLAPPFYEHYGELVAAPIALMIGITVGAALAIPRSHWASALQVIVTGTGVAVAIAGLWFAMGDLPPRWHDSTRSIAAASALISEGDCVVSDSPVTAFETPNLFARTVADGAPAVDSFGAALRAGTAEPVPPSSFDSFVKRLSRCRWFAGSSSWSPSRGYPSWSSEESGWFAEHYSLVAEVRAGIELWRRN